MAFNPHCVAFLAIWNVLGGYLELRELSANCSLELLMLFKRSTRQKASLPKSWGRCRPSSYEPEYAKIAKQAAIVGFA
jgi:hypothetical protein